MEKISKSILVLSDDSYHDVYSAKGMRARREVELLKTVYKEVKVLVLSRKNPQKNLLKIESKRVYIPFLKLSWVIAPLVALKIRKITRSYDYIFSINLNNGWLGYFSSIITGIPLILDYHGVVPEERKYVGGSDIKFNFFKFIEKIVLKKAHRVLVVSQNMKKHLVNDLGIIENKLSILPNCIEEWFINNNKEVSVRREEARKNLGLEDKFILVYCGSASKWQKAEVMVDLYDRLRSINKDFHLLIMTGEKEKFNKIIRDRGLTNCTTVISADHSKVPELLPAGDIGLLLRDENIVNRVAAPTKTAEYLACGVPILATLGIGNIDEISHFNKISKQITLDFDNNLSQIIEYAEDIRSKRPEYINSTSKLATERFNWDFYKKTVDFS